MILNEELYLTATVWTKIPCQCDYCHCLFERTKRNIRVGRTIINKESCNSKECAKEKRKESQKLKYGVENAGGTFESLEKARVTWEKKYNVSNPMSLDETKHKIQQTCLKRYGKTSYLETAKCREQLKQYSLENFNTENVSQAEEIKSKMRETCLKKYNVPHPRQSPDLFLEYQLKFFEKHGVFLPNQLPDHLEKRQLTCVEKYGFPHPTTNLDIQKKIRDTCIERYGRFPVNIFGKTENEIREFVKDLNFKVEKNWSLLNGKEVDIFIPEMNLAIEYCGLFWHNEMSPSPRNRNYHYDKYIKLKNQGVQLLTIFEDEWLSKKDVCKSVISAKLGVITNKIAARKCTVEILDKSIAKNFVDKNHIQGSGDIKAAYGLFYNGDLVSCITYGNHHRKAMDSDIVTRMCSLSQVVVVGGFSKIFKYASQYHKNVITWSDNRWSNGKIYEKLGFNLNSNLPPDYSYYKYGSCGKRKSKQSMKKSNTGCPKEVTEREWCLENGYARIWDCGKIKWTFTT